MKISPVDWTNLVATMSFCFSKNASRMRSISFSGLVNESFVLLRSWSFKLWEPELSGASGNWVSVEGLSGLSPLSFGGTSGSSFPSFFSLELPPLPSFEIPFTKSGRGSTPTRLKCNWHIVNTSRWK